MTISLMGEDRVLMGRVESVSRGITDPNAAPGSEGLAAVNPTFSWVRSRNAPPIRIALEPVPDAVRLAAGMTCTITVAETRSEGVPGRPPSAP